MFLLLFISNKLIDFISINYHLIIYFKCVNRFMLLLLFISNKLIDFMSINYYLIIYNEYVN